MPTSAADVALPRMPPCARATVGQSWERSWPSATQRCWVCLPSADRELPSRGSLHSRRTLGSGLPISTLFSPVIYVAGILWGKMSGPHRRGGLRLRNATAEYSHASLADLYPAYSSASPAP